MPTSSGTPESLVFAIVSDYATRYYTTTAALAKALLDGSVAGGPDAGNPRIEVFGRIASFSEVVLAEPTPSFDELATRALIDTAGSSSGAVGVRSRKDRTLLGSELTQSLDEALAALIAPIAEAIAAGAAAADPDKLAAAAAKSALPPEDAYVEDPND